GRAVSTPAGGRDRRRGHGGGGGDAELLLELLEELAQLQDRHVGDGVEDLFLGGHYFSPSSADSEDSSAGASVVASGAGLSSMGSAGGASPSLSGGAAVAS